MARPRRVIEDSDDDDEASPAAAVVRMDVDDGDDDDSLEEPRPPSPSPPPPAPPPPPRPAPHRRGGRHARLRSRLSSQAGVDPSPAWLDACVRHVGGEDEEAAWDQILRADLRDVVRVEPGDGDGDGDGGDGGDEGGKGPAARLREAVAKSSSAAGEADGGNGTNGRYQSRKAALPSDFRLLVQVEEVVDVTMSAEQQLAAGGGGGGAAGGATGPNGGGNPYGSSGPRGAGGPQQQQRNPQYRCLKMVLSDGYHSNGRSTPPSAENGSDGKDANPTFLAMETSPIQHLGTSSPPGIKLLLHGAIDVRVGMLQLNEGNCAVLGGSVEGWGEAMRKARERAARERGLGVDPTIKALIWNPLTGDEEEVDEGEGESGDVAAAPPPPPAAPVAPAPPPPPQPTPAPNNNAYPNARTSSQYTNQSRGSSAPNASLSGTGSGTMRQRTLDSYPKKPRPDTTRLRPGDDAPASNWQQRTIATQSRGASNNPYQRASGVDPGRNAPSGVEAPPRQQQQQRQPQQQQHQQQQHQQHQRQMQTNTNIIPVNGSPPSSTSQTTSIQPQQRAQPNPYASLRPIAAESHPSVAAKTPAPSAKSAATPFTSNPSFSELISLLQSVRSDRALYERYYGRVITVPCKINGKDSKDNVFNIVKSASPGGGSEKKKGKSKKKYEFFLVAKFFGPKQSDGAVACRVESSVLERYFDGYSPAEVRKLSREDKAATNRVVNQSCSQFVHDFSSLGQVQMKLLLTPDEFFAKVPTLSASDWFAGTANPFLLAIKRT